MIKDYANTEVILLAAGLGKRMRIDHPKQFFALDGKPVLAYSLEVFNKLKLGKIVLVCQQDYLSYYQKIVQDYDIKNVELVMGGETRQESVKNGLAVINSDIVLVHEAARPLISEAFVDEVMAAVTQDVDGVVPVLPLNFTVALGRQTMENTLERSQLRNIQLPQAFKKKTLQKAHELATKEGFEATDDSTLVFHYGGKIKFIDGRESNIKITTLFDVKMISNFLSLGNE